MSTIREICQYYQDAFQKIIPEATVTRWAREGRLKAIKLPNGRYDYDMENFINIVNSSEY